MVKPLWKGCLDAAYAQCSPRHEGLFRGLWRCCFWYIHPSRVLPSCIHTSASLASRASPQKNEVAISLGTGKQTERSPIALSLPWTAALITRCDPGCAVGLYCPWAGLWSWSGTGAELPLSKVFLTQSVWHPSRNTATKRPFWHRAEAICEVKFIVGVCHGFLFKCGLESMYSNSLFLKKHWFFTTKEWKWKYLGKW